MRLMRGKVPRELLLSIAILILMLVPFVRASTSQPRQAVAYQVYVNLEAQPQNLLTKLVNTWYTNLDINVRITFENTGTAAFNGTILIHVTAPTGWSTDRSFSLSLRLNQTAYNSFVFTPRESGVYDIQAKSYSGSIANIGGGFLPLDVEPSSSYTNLVLEAMGVGVTLVGVVVGVLGGAVALGRRR
jgi:hypothetical protein